MKKTLCLLLVVLMLASVALVACNDNVGDVSVTDESEAPKGYVPHLGETKKHDGKVLKILSGEHNVAFEKEAYDATEVTGEPVNDASLNRNEALKKNYGFTIEAIWTKSYGDMIERVRDDKASGSDTYQAISTGVGTLASLAAEGFLTDLYSIENSNLQLDQPWWDGAANEDMSIANKLYFSTGDIVMRDDENTYCVIYNLEMIKENNLDNPAQLVLDGEWTLDAWYEMAKAVARPDSNGEWTVNSDAVWGSVMDSFQVYHLVCGANCPMVEKTDEDDIPTLAISNERNFDMFVKVSDMVSKKSYLTYTEAFGSWDDATTKSNFEKGQALFLVAPVGTVNGASIRDSEVAYGILPMPKGDKEQETYASATNPYQFVCIGINSKCDDLDFTTFALEAMAWSAREYITPEYYERTLKNKRALEDENAAKMLDILFSNRLVDLSIVFNWNDCIQWYNQCVTGGGNSLTSLVESKQDAFYSQMEETIEMFTK